MRGKLNKYVIFANLTNININFIVSMKKLFLFFIAITVAISAGAQVVNSEETNSNDKKSEKADEGWKYSAVFNLNFGQTSLTNWAAGGQNSIALNGLASFGANYTQGKTLWTNSLDLGYGFVRQGKGDDATVQKTEDKIDFASKYGYQVSDKLYVAALLGFKTQFTNGYDYPNDSVAVSGFMSPGYLQGAIGIDYKPTDKLSVFVSPITSKTTIVKDDVLSDAGAFGVEKGDHVKSEFGGSLKAMYEDAFLEGNLQFKTKLELFSNYLDKPQNIDVNWEVLMGMKVTKYIGLSLSTQLLYDDDISGKVQFKEIFGVGISYMINR